MRNWIFSNTGTPHQWGSTIPSVLFATYYLRLLSFTHPTRMEVKITQRNIIATNIIQQGCSEIGGATTGTGKFLQMILFDGKRKTRREEEEQNRMRSLFGKVYAVDLPPPSAWWL